MITEDLIERVEHVSEKDLEIIHLCRDVFALGQVIGELGGTMGDRVRAAICAEKVLNLHGMELSGTGYWRDGKVVATHEELDSSNEGV